MATAQVICTDALLISRVMRQAGQAPPSEQLNYALRRANDIMAGWSQGSDFVYTTRIDVFTISPLSQAFYTIGPSGANFTAPRPTKITLANLILASTNVRIPLRLWDDDEWANVRAKAITGTIPTGLYNDGSAPNSSLYLWPIPTVGNQIELFSPQRGQQFASTSDNFIGPDGYENALKLSLAEYLARELPNGVPSGQLVRDAARARARINGQDPPKMIPAGVNSSLDPRTLIMNPITRERY